MMLEGCLSKGANSPDNILILIGRINRMVTRTTVSYVYYKQEKAIASVNCDVLKACLLGLKGLVKEMHCCPS